MNDLVSDIKKLKNKADYIYIYIYIWNWHVWKKYI